MSLLAATIISAVDRKSMFQIQIEDTGLNGGIWKLLSLTLADLGGVCESILHASPDMDWNFYTVSAWPGHERNLMRPYFASDCRDGIAEGENGF